MARSPASAAILTSQKQPAATMSTYRSYVTDLINPNIEVETKLKKIQNVSDALEVIVTNQDYPTFLSNAIRVFVQVLETEQPHFISEHVTQQTRKLILEIIQRLPTNDKLSGYVEEILTLMFKLLEVENEENVLIVLRIIIEFHKQYKPLFRQEILNFLAYVKNIYKELPKHLDKIFGPQPVPVVKDLSFATLSPLLERTYIITTIPIRGESFEPVNKNLIPKGTMSLKALAELPIIVVLMYQLYKKNVHNDVSEFIPLIMETITLQPTEEQRNHDNFNKEVFVDFMAAQIKTLSFLAYIVRIYHEEVKKDCDNLAKGMVSLLRLCPQEVAHLRKELLIAARHILATDLKFKFVGCLDDLFDENVLIGSGWTAYESLRPLAYSTLADLVHHIRQHLSFKDLSKAVTVFSKNVHDESLVTTIQTMSCKLLLNLVEGIHKTAVVEVIHKTPGAERKVEHGRELLMRMLEVFVLKFKTIAKLQLPVLMAKSKQQLQNLVATQSTATVTLQTSQMLSTQAGSTQTSQPSTPQPHTITVSQIQPSLIASEARKEIKTILPGAMDERKKIEIKSEPKEEVKTPVTVGLLDGKEEKTKFGFPASQAANYTVTDCRSLVKTLVCGVKTITWGLANCKPPAAEQFQPKETLVFIRLMKYALQALDIYTLSPPPTPGQPQNRAHSIQAVRSKEEKDVLEHLAGVYTMMHPLTFREVFSTIIDYMVDRIYKNIALQIVANTFLANEATSPIFATILVEYLLKRMEEMGSDNKERSNLYLKLFKLVFGSVSLFQKVNEQMLKPYLHQIVNRSMDLALSAEEPYNYFLLLRALFRSIGGGSHDELYNEFLPLLPNLLQGLNSLQSGLHKQHMKDLFVELCLTVPVRLSSLLPYLPMLMDPLVSALNGSQTLVSQGLRTLELCVDNLQPEFLYDHIQPVRAELMQALWRTLRNPVDSVAQVAFRVLGKFGGGNRKMMIEPQRLEYSSRENVGPCIEVHFPDHKNHISMPIGKIIETAFNALKASTTDSYYRRQCWDVIEGFIASNLQQEDPKHSLYKFFSHPSFINGEIPPIQGPYYQCPDPEARKIHEMALTGMFVAAAIKELTPIVVVFMFNVVHHYTLVALSQQCGPFASSRQLKQDGMDPYVLIDATAAIMGHEEKELCKPGKLALKLIMDTSATVCNSKERASSLPLFEYICEKMCALCYERAWYAKLGGCEAIKVLFEQGQPKWVYSHLYVFLKASLFVMMDLTGEVSSGAVDMAKSNLEKMLSTYAKPCNEKDKDLLELQSKALNDVVQELVRQITSPNNCVREQAMHSLMVIADAAKKPLTSIIEPHKEFLADYIPPRKHLLKHQPINAQIGLLDGNTFCITLKPKLFSIDLEQHEHKTFFTELMSLCDYEDAALQKLPCYKPVSNLVPLRKATLRVLAACYYIKDKRQDIFLHLYKALCSSIPELQDTAFTCLKEIEANYKVDDHMINETIRQLLIKMEDYKTLSVPIIQHLSFLTQLFPHIFKEYLGIKLNEHLDKCLDIAVTVIKTSKQVNVPEMKLCIGIINIFHQIPAVGSNFIKPILQLVLKTEKALHMEAGSPFKEPLLKFLKKYPTETMDILLTGSNVQNEQLIRFIAYLLKGEHGKPFREVLMKNPQKLINMAASGISSNSSTTAGTESAAPREIPKHELQFQAIRIVSLIVKYDDKWLSNQHILIGYLRSIWISKEFQERHQRTDTVNFTQWKEPKLLAKCLLNFVKHHTSNIELLFQLLRAFTGRFIPDFEFLRDFLENTVANTYSVEWKKMAFLQFVEVYPDPQFPQDLKAKILQYILIPSFAYAFDKNKGEEVIGGKPEPDQDSNNNVISLFISKIINSDKVISPDNPIETSDAVRILLLQFSCLLVEQAYPHIHDIANKRQGDKLRSLMTFAWPCLLTRSCVDPATKYHGHLLLANIIAKFAIHKRIVMQVFHSLLKAHAAEARAVVRQALEIITPSMPLRMEDGNDMLTHWTQKIIVEEGHTLAQLVHMLQLLVRHYKVYYPVRHHLIQHMVSSVQRLVFTPNATIEHKRLAVDLAEVIIRWEIQRHKEEQEKNAAGYDKTEVTAELTKKNLERHQENWAAADIQSPESSQGMRGAAVVKRALNTDLSNAKKKRHSSDSGTNLQYRYKAVDKKHADAVVNFLLRMACQVNETSTTAGTTGELLSKRCVALLKTALKPDMWPSAELKLSWFHKLLITVEHQQPNYGNICTALELLAFLVNILRKETVLSTFTFLQQGIASCLTCNNTKVIRSLHNLLSKLMSTFPTETTNSNKYSKHEELESLYAAVSKVVLDGLTQYEKQVPASPAALFATLMILKAACDKNPCYIDRLITFFMRILQKMAKEHLTPQTAETNPELKSMGTDLLILSLDLVKNRVGVMGQDMRKTFIGTILVGLIEKSSDVKVLKAITRMVEDWVKSKSTIAVNQSPSIREKSILLVKMMQFIEKRFPSDLDLNAQFLKLVHYVYSDESLKGTELQSKLEPAFMAGLRCVQPHIRAEFFKVFDTSMRRKLHERLMYIVCSQNWETIGPHFWIKQCIELILITATDGTFIQSASQNTLLPSISSVIEQADSQERANYDNVVRIKEEPMDVSSENKEEEIDIEMSSTEDGHNKSEGTLDSGQRTCQNLLVTQQPKLNKHWRKVETITFLKATAQLCHMDTNLAQYLWIQMFPRLWKILTDKQQSALGSELVPFLCSGSHVIQKDCHPSASGTFTEAVSLCDPSVPIKPIILKYLGRSHNLWHRACLLLEQACLEKGVCTQVKSRTMADIGDDSAHSYQHEALDMIAELYSLLKEEDLWGGLWQKRAKYSETSVAVALEQQGFFLQAQVMFEQVMVKHKQDIMFASPINMQSEVMLWYNHWTRCARELNQWEFLLDYGMAPDAGDPYLTLEFAWRAPNWTAMKEALEQVEQNCPKELAWKVHMYKGYNYICHPDEQHLNMVERVVELASNLCIREWRRLPHIVSHIHLPMLQAAQQIMELQDAVQIHQGLLPANLGRGKDLPDMKAIVKTWRNRLPMICDDLSHWSEIFYWRQEHYKTIVASYEPTQSGQQNEMLANHAMLGVHASAQSIIHYGKIARKHGLTSVCLEALGRIHSIPSVPIVDCFQKIRQQVKCFLQMAHVSGKNDPNETNFALSQGLDVIESTNLKYFTKEMTAEFYALKGVFLSQMGRLDEANKSFSAAVQLHDTLVKAWALWGDYLEQIFTKDKPDTKPENRNMQHGVSALTCFLHSCRHTNESKSRKYLAKVLWLLTYDDEALTLTDAVDKYCVGVPPLQWLPWVPQLLTCIVRNEGKVMMNIISHVGRVYPQAIYFPIRTLYLILKIEQRERYKSESKVMQSGSNPSTPSMPSSPAVGATEPTSVVTSHSAADFVTTQPVQSVPDGGPIKATTPMWRCSRIMHTQRDYHPTVLSSLEGIVDQMVWFRENVYEEVLRQLRQGLAKCYAVAYENAGAVSEASVTPHTSNFVKKLVSTFGIGVENVSSIANTYPTAASESLLRRAQATAQDPVFQKMKNQFTADFDFSVPGAMKLHNLITKLKKWIKILEAKAKLFPKSFLIEERCRFLSNFSQQTAEVEIPGEFLLPRHNHYFVRISRFMPRVDIVQKHNTAARRLYIKGHNGKIYPYLVVNDACLSDARKEERVLQLLRMLNHYLGKQKETSRRFLNFTVPRVVSVSPQMRLVEDNVSSISLLDIYKQRCAKKGMEHDAPLARFYERLATVQARGSQASHQVLRDILKDVQSIMVSKTMLKEWAKQTYPSATDYWTFRKQFILQLSLAGFVEYVLHLTRLNPDMMYIHQDSGLMNISYFRFNVDDVTGELDATRPVPFRLTPNISEFITTIGICGPMTASMISTARCLVLPNFKIASMLKAILRDEMIAWYKKRQDDSQPSNSPPESDGSVIIQMVTKAVAAITTRLQSLSAFDGTDSKVSTLVAAANSHDNLCRMDPAWHPWL